MGRSIEAFESSRQKTNLWLKDLCEELRSDNRHQAYSALRAVLHTLRDCLPTEETAKFAGQLPLIVKGVFYDGWRPHPKPLRLSRGEFYEEVRQRLRGTGVDPVPAVRAVLRLFGARLSAGEIAAVQRVLPHEVRELWLQMEEERALAARQEQAEADEAADRRGFLGADRRAPIWP